MTNRKEHFLPQQVTDLNRAICLLILMASSNSTRGKNEFENEKSIGSLSVAYMLKQIAPENEYGELDIEPTAEVVEFYRSSPRSFGFVLDQYLTNVDMRELTVP